MPSGFGCSVKTSSPSPSIMRYGDPCENPNERPSSCPTSPWNRLASKIVYVTKANRAIKVPTITHPRTTQNFFDAFILSGITFPNDDVVAPARSSSDSKKDVTAGCHSRLIVKGNLGCGWRSENSAKNRQSPSTQAGPKPLQSPSTKPQPKTLRRIGKAQAHKPRRRICEESNEAPVIRMVWMSHDR
jgi:hypothetical protein